MRLWRTQHGTCNGFAGSPAVYGLVCIGDAPMPLTVFPLFFFLWRILWIFFPNYPVMNAGNGSMPTKKIVVICQNGMKSRFLRL